MKDFKEKHLRATNAFSRWYSTKIVILLKKYEQDNNKNYDLVFLTRLDWAFLKPMKLNLNMKKNLSFQIIMMYHHRETDINLKLKITKQREGLADYWFIEEIIL